MNWSDAEKIMENNFNRFNSYKGKPVKGGKKKKDDKDQQILEGFKLEYSK